MYSGYCACCEPNPTVCACTPVPSPFTRQIGTYSLLCSPSELPKPLMEALADDSRMLLAEVIATLRVLT